MGSVFGDSQLVRLCTEQTAEGSFVEELERFTNLGPIVDFAVVDLDREQQQNQVRTSSSWTPSPFASVPFHRALGGLLRCVVAVCFGFLHFCSQNQHHQYSQQDLLMLTQPPTHPHTHAHTHCLRPLGSRVHCDWGPFLR